MTTGAAPENRSAGFVQMIERASVEPGLRGAIIWFPERAIAQFGLTGEEARATRTGDLTGLALPESIRVKALEVFDLHDLHAGE